MDSFNELNQVYFKKCNKRNTPSQEGDTENDSKNFETETNKDLEKNVKDLELQLEYEINQHELEISEKDETIKKLEEKIYILENSKNEDEKDEAILNMSEKLLMLSNKYDLLEKESKLKEEELKHLKNKKKYRNDKTNEYIMSLKNQNEEFKKNYDTLNEKYVQLLKECNGIKDLNKSLQEKLEEHKTQIEVIKKDKINESFDENNALKILNLKNNMLYKNNANKDMDDLNTLKFELEYKDMIIQKLIKKNLSNDRVNTQQTDYNDQIANNEKKIDELYKKYLDVQSDRDKSKVEINNLNNDLKQLKKENSNLIATIEKLRNSKSSDSKHEMHINQFDDLLNNLLKENSELNEEISKQKNKNITDTYYFNKELEMIKSDKFKVIEKFDSKKIKKIPHLFQPVSVTLNMKNEKNNFSDDDKNMKSNHDLYKSNSNSNCKLSTPIITDDLVHIYIKDYMEKVKK